jgi:hypothetical protein
LCSSYSNSQTTDSVTGNLINYSSTPTDTTGIWNNGVYVNQLGCFGGNSGTGYCGPNPNVQTSGNINFSYGQINLNQIVNITKHYLSAEAEYNLADLTLALWQRMVMDGMTAGKTICLLM